jgi:hypothetical protein
MSAVSGVEFTQRSTLKAGMSPAALAAPGPMGKASRRRRFPRLYGMTLWVAAMVIATVAKTRRRLVFILVTLLSDG